MKELSSEKQGAKCCGCCCDMRRAVIILNILGSIIFVISLIIWVTVEDWEARVLPDDYFSSHAVATTMAPIDGQVPMHITLDALAIAASFLSMFGAILFNSMMVGIGVFVVVGNFIGNLVLQIMYYKDVEEMGWHINWMVLACVWAVNFIILVFYSYASGAFISENLRGIMTKSNYKKEENSCCCV